MAQRIIPYGRQEITQEDIAAVVATLQSDYLTQGPAIAKFEQDFSTYVNAKFAVAVANGTAALHLAAISLGVNAKSKVITTPITFSASANCVKYAGGEVVFCDIDKDSYNIDINKVEALLSKHPKGTFAGIIPVCMAGYPVDTENLRKIADNYGLWILEDACHAPGGYFINSKNEKIYCGSNIYTDATVFSFHPVKHIATGEGGLVTTKNVEIFNKISLLRTHGITKEPELLHENHGGWYYEMQTLGYNYRITDIQASLGLSQLKKANERLLRRRQIAEIYNKELQNLPLKLPKVEEKFYHAYHLYIIQTEKRKELYDYLRTKGIYAQVHYIPVHLQPFYRQLGWKKSDFPVAETYYEKCLSIPMYPSLSDDDLQYVIEQIKSFYN